MNEELTEILNERFEDLVFRKAALGDVIEVPARRFYEVASFLKEDERFAFDFLNNYTAVDRPPERIELYALLFSYPHRRKLALCTSLDRADPRIRTISDLWPAADWYEREMFDLFGIVFAGHPDLRRLFLPDYWKGHPLRKDYADSRIIPKPEVFCE